MCNTFVSNILSKKEKKWFRCLLTSLCPASHVKQAGRKALGSSHVAQFIATLGLKPHNKLLPLVVQKLTQQRLHPELIPSWRSKINHSPPKKLLQSQHHSSGVPTETSSLDNPTRIPKSSHIHPALHEPQFKNTSLYEKQLDAFSGQQFIFFPFRSGFPCNMHQNCVEARVA